LDINKTIKDEDADNVEKEIRKLEEKEKRRSVCPYCSQRVEFIWIHGHYQCPICKNVVVSCCGDS
jgi:tRNA(Ile2) C34 agmatinyltransferase TiaS